MTESSGFVAAGLAFSNTAVPGGQETEDPYRFLIVEGHRDIWEFNDRVRLSRRATASTLKDYLLPRLLEGGVNVTIMPAGGDSVAERGDDPRLLEGSLRVIDMFLVEVEKTAGAVSLILKKGDLPTRPERNRVKLFLDVEGGASFQYQEPEPEFHPDRKLAMLRHFFRLGVRGVQLTHNGRNMLGVGIAEGKVGTPLSEFGVEVVREMNRLGMIVGVSHLSTEGIKSAVKASSHPIMSTHQNLQKFMGSDNPLHLSDAEVKLIASTGGVVGMRYIRDQTSYELLADEIVYIKQLVGIDHAAIGWLGHDRGSTRATGDLPEAPNARRPTGVEAETMFEHWNKFIGLLRHRGLKDEEIAKVLGGNFLRVMHQVLPA
jgi:membrane dipeptidase